jgi:threonylcarbamoyladenosine tRNA methylthiotransferase MtaB
MEQKRVAFHTLGCKLNYSESSDLSRKFVENGYKLVDFHETADVYVINTCTVTALAEKKCRNAIRQASGRNPEAKVAVIGCFSQLKADELQHMEGIDIILGNQEKHQLLEMLGHAPGNQDESCAYCHVDDISKTHNFVPSFSSGDRTRSFLKIQDGCDYFCSYCAIPFARGRSRSNTIAETVETAKSVAASGVKEVVLTGVNIGDFGKNNGESFFGLIQELEKLEGIERYRISSIEPDLLSNEIIEFVAKSKKFLPHFHIPLQAAEDSLLKAMRRKYDTALFASRVAKIKEVMPHACIAADLIVGFPGETEGVFAKCIDFLESIPISYLHVFTYSERPGTLALKLNEKVPVNIRRDRSKILHELSEKKKLSFYKENNGLTTNVLWESDEEKGMMSGFTENYVRVKRPFDSARINQIEIVELTNPDQSGEYYIVG